MTRTKVEFATILASLRGDGSDPQKLAQEMTLRKLCHEIEKIEEAAEAQVPIPTDEKPTAQGPQKRTPLKSLWSFLTLEDSDEE